MIEAERFSETWVAVMHEIAVSALPHEWESHPEITSDDGRIEFIRNGLDVSYDELAEILPSGNNGGIDPMQLNFAFSAVSYLQGELKEGALAQVVRRRAPKWGNRTMVEVFQAGQADLILGHYVQLLSWR